ncbi:uncharacterized protein LOC119404016 [Rhipicephalus sanguineus]|uniref:uncharacterized protein LOC119404016 n=1 Tax=Rhipicephalus sanguineus TaxID=34632 RepID=UPI00189450F5|nr:uncharacterized protein LOC119404016 [Rhipicephalus sanguineus]
MKVTVLSLCLVLSAICAVRAQSLQNPLFCPLRLRLKVHVLQCTVRNLQEKDQNRMIKVMTYNGLDYNRLGWWICTPQAEFALRKVFTKKQLRRITAVGIQCILYLYRDFYRTSNEITPAYTNTPSNEFTTAYTNPPSNEITPAYTNTPTYE